jgi:chemotaxis signal transduction protein
MLASTSSSASIPQPVVPGSQAILLFTLGGARYGLPLTHVERVLPMAAVLRLPDRSSGMLGVLNLHGAVLPVVDPRPRLGIASPTWTADQRLIVLTTPTLRFLLWVDGVEDVVDQAPEPISGLSSAASTRLTTHVLRQPGELVPVLSAAALQECATGQ